MKTSQPRESGHTPGPWHVGTDAHTILNECGIAIAQVFSRGTETPSPEANARLIAAAPTLYVALEGLTKAWVGLVESGDAGYWDAEKDPEIIAARKALAEARP